MAKSQEAELIRLGARIAELEEALEDTGDIAGICVGLTLGRRCHYCRCEGKNLDVEARRARDKEELKR